MYPLIALPAWVDPNGTAQDQEPFITYSGIQIPIDIQPESPEMTALSEGEIFSTFHFFTSYSGIRPGWRLYVVGSNPQDSYIVRGVEKFAFGAGIHWEGTLAKESQP